MLLSLKADESGFRPVWKNLPARSGATVGWLNIMDHLAATQLFPSSDGKHENSKKE